MFRKLSVITMFVAVSALSASAQEVPPVPSTPPVERAQALSFDAFFDASYLGVQTKEVSKENYAQYGLREVRGVAVEKVIENSPAERAGLQNGDVIVRFDGSEVTSTRKLSRLISEVAPDHQANLTVVRNGSEREIKVTVGKREFPKFENAGTIFGQLSPLPAMPAMPAMPDMPRVPLTEAVPFPPAELKDGNFLFFGSGRRIGISVASLTEQLGDYFGVRDGKGVLVSSVRENSPASKAGLQAGDVIVEVDGKEVKSSLDLTRLKNEKKEGSVNLTIIRNKSRQNISVEPKKSDENMRIIAPNGRGARISVSPTTVVTPSAVISTAPGRVL